MLCNNDLADPSTLPAKQFLRTSQPARGSIKRIWKRWDITVSCPCILRELCMGSLFPCRAIFL